MSNLAWRARARLEARLGYPALRRKFRRRHGYDVDLASPRTFNEKIQWRKLFDHDPLFRVVADKAAMRDWARPRLAAGDRDAAPPYLAVVDDAGALDLDALPADVALKATHGSSWNLLLRAGDGRDRAAVRRRLSGWLSRTYGIGASQLEWAYWGIAPRIAVEPLILWSDGRLAEEVKFHMFGGRVGFVQLETGADGGTATRRQSHYGPGWTPLRVHSKITLHESPPPPPRQIEAMTRIAHDVARGWDYLRVDLLFTDDVVRLSELTLYRNSGFTPLLPRAFDEEMGAMWDLPGPGHRRETRDAA